MTKSLKWKFAELLTIFLVFVTAQIWGDNKNRWGWWVAVCFAVVLYGSVCESLGRAKEREQRAKIAAAGLEELP